MRQVYLLLRNNKETGPHSFDELLQLQLKPFDLIWVEGRSAAWRYPTEIAELSPFIPEPPVIQEQTQFYPVTEQKNQGQPVVFNNTAKTVSASRHIHVSLPGNKSVFQTSRQVINSEPVTTTVKETLQPTTPEPFLNTSPQDNTINTKYSRLLNEAEEDYTNWIYKKKTAKKPFLNRKNLAPAALVLTIVAAACFVFAKLSFTKTEPPAQTAVVRQPQEAVTNNESTTATDEGIPVTENLSTVSNSVVSKTENNITPKKEPVILKHRSTITTKNKNLTIQNNPAIQEKQIINQQPKEVVTQDNQNTVPQVNKPAKEKKKKLGEVLKDFFGRFKNKKQTAQDEQAVPEEPKHADGRNSTKRDNVPATDNTIDATAIADQIDILANTPADGWMMGISGLKITLRNRSNLTLKSAAVNVLYYDENNRLLETKTIYFSNVPANGKQTVAAPDQKWADHTAYKLGAVSARDDRFVKN